MLKFIAFTKTVKPKKKLGWRYTRKGWEFYSAAFPLHPLDLQICGNFFRGPGTFRFFGCSLVLLPAQGKLTPSLVLTPSS